MGVNLLISVGSWASVGSAIDNEIRAVNSMGIAITNIMTKNEIYDKLIEAIPSEIKDAVKAIAISLVSLFFVLDFIHRSTDLKWVTWENVLMFFIKIIIAKMCVDNSEWLMDCIYKGFNSLADFGIGAPDIIPWSQNNNPDVGDIFSDINNKVARYQFFLSEEDARKAANPANFSVAWNDFAPVGCWLLAIIQGFIMKAIMAVTLIIVLARFMELTIYTVAAPISLSTMGCDGLQEIGKSFLKSYAACCIHVLVLFIIFSSYSALNIALTNLPNPMSLLNVSGFMGLIKTFILGASVMKSEQWAKRICGAI